MCFYKLKIPNQVPSNLEIDRISTSIKNWKLRENQNEALATGFDRRNNQSWIERLYWKEFVSRSAWPHSGMVSKRDGPPGPVSGEWPPIETFERADLNVKHGIKTILMLWNSNLTIISMVIIFAEIQMATKKVHGVTLLGTRDGITVISMNARNLSISV